MRGLFYQYNHESEILVQFFSIGIDKCAENTS